MIRHLKVSLCKSVLVSIEETLYNVIWLCVWEHVLDKMAILPFLSGLGLAQVCSVQKHNHISRELNVTTVNSTLSRIPLWLMRISCIYNTDLSKLHLDKEYIQAQWTINYSQKNNQKEHNNHSINRVFTIAPFGHVNIVASRSILTIFTIILKEK